MIKKNLVHLLVIMAYLTRQYHAKPQFLITSDTGYEKFREKYGGAQDESSENYISPLTATNEAHQKRPLMPLLNVITDIKSEFGVQRARNISVHPYLKMPTFVAPMMKPEQVEIISRDKMELGGRRGGSNVVVIKPKIQKNIDREAKSSTLRDTDRIIFPSDFEDLVNSNPYNGPNRRREQPSMDVRFGESRFVPRGCRDGSVVCSNTDDYPSDHINKVINKNRARLVEFFGDDIVPQVVQRVDYQDDEPLCHSRELVLYPTMGQTKDNKWAYIINNGNFSQGVRVEQCIGQDRPCAFTDHFPYGYTTECKQKFIYRHLLALDENGETVKNLFRLPACCKCVVRSTFGGNVFSRHASLKRDASKDVPVTEETETTTTMLETTTTK